MMVQKMVHLQGKYPEKCDILRVCGIGILNPEFNI